MKMIDFRRALDYLACPYCKGSLKYAGSEYMCSACDKIYPIIQDIPRFIEIKEEILDKAKAHWENSPSFQYEAKTELYTKEYYEEQDKWRAEEVDPFSMDEYKFDEVKNRVILDIGCGSGWVIKHAAKSGAFAIGVDFAERACVSSRKALDTYNLDGLIVQADAQHLPIKGDVIDRVYSIGVLHHIPDTEKGIGEAYRILKNSGTGFISLYGKLFFFNPVLFPIATLMLKLLLKAPPVRDGIQGTKNYDEFYRFIDGATNPIGRWYTDSELYGLFRKFEVCSYSKSHFPLRYLKIGSISLKEFVPKYIHRFFEKQFGMMRNFQLYKVK